jgi:hypothetical protein
MGAVAFAVALLLTATASAAPLLTGPSLEAPEMVFAPLGVRLAGTAVVSGHVYDFSGVPLGGAPVAWAVTTGGIVESGASSTGADGAYTLTGLPAAQGTGELLVSSPVDPWAIGRFDATWPDPGTTTFDLRPGIVTASVRRGGPSPDWSEVTCYLYGSDAVSNVAGMAGITGTGDIVTGDAYAAPGTYASGAVYFSAHECLEFATAAKVTAGKRSVQTIDVDQNAAQRIGIARPFWASGAPGTAVTVAHEGFPAAWTLGYSGYSDSPASTASQPLGSLTTASAEPFAFAVKVPAGAPAGYLYVVQVQHREGRLVLSAPFQVCTLKSSRATVRRGGSIRLRGAIPTEGHLGAEAGIRKWVTVYARTRRASQPPPVWNAGARGWKVVTRVRADGYGRYATGALHPSRTTWYVVRYPGDGWYQPAYTSVIRVRVR